MLDVVGEEGLGLLITDTGVNDDIPTLLPVNGSGDAVLVTELQRVDHSEDLIEGSANLGGVGEGETDDLLGVDHEDSSDLKA